MQIRSVMPRSRYLERDAIDLSQSARRRLRWFDYYRACGGNAALTCRYLGISRQTFHRWKRRYDPQNLHSLEDGSHRPHRRREPTSSAQVAERVLGLRRQYPRWGKDKLVVLLGREGRVVSTSMVGRILTRLKQRGVLVEPRPNRDRTARARSWSRPYAVRKPRDWPVERPGDLVDTLEVRPVPGVVLKQFTARDVVLRWDVIEAHGRATSTAAAHFLHTLQQRMPFPVRALQVDGGSEFAAAFEDACQRRGLKLFVPPPRSPKLNGAVERAQRTHTEEFYEVTPCSLPIAQLNQELQDWERTYNTVRPHQALGYRTPQEFLTQAASPSQLKECH